MTASEVLKEWQDATADRDSKVRDLGTMTIEQSLVVLNHDIRRTMWAVDKMLKILAKEENNHHDN